MSKKTGWIIVILMVLLALALIYIIYLEGTKYVVQKQVSVFQQGAQVGYEQAVVQIVQQAATCNQVPLRVGNQTINIIAVDCLNQQ